MELSSRDVELLACLSREPGRVFTRENLLQDVWGYRCTGAVETRCVDMHMAKLRKKLAELIDTPVIETVRGAGYRVKES